MNKYILGFCALSLVACTNDNDVQEAALNSQNAENIQLQRQVEQLKLELSNKDSLINESIAFFNEIQDNLASISVKKDDIQIKSSDPELGEDGRKEILQQIQNINFLREQNARKVRQLQGKLKSSNMRIEELQSMVDRLVLQIKAKDEQIESLQNQLADLDVQYSELFDQYQEQVDLNLETMMELNTVYYAMGSVEELVENNVIVKEGGFIGIGKKTDLSADMNENYFTKGDKTKIKEITVGGKEPKFITDHPSDSYKWEGGKLIITDAQKFWKISKYLVIEIK
ncbi:hypothetical protein SAMN05216474_0104 [Lishizhenia tianjinensis]|uniref:Uncharacterized protein n=1 Tax=Lishizhenia tianjinensis TaxID=477690 RepID=A0A1I6XDB8_9FLAO|nr:hypothetical protein [Lishizhenia tianjinensis]SFT36091.1 hypothetical protein SAMN05216474_0104 [Lishizhenia tianjinensis]